MGAIDEMKKLLGIALLACVLVAPGCVYANVVTPLDNDAHVTEFGEKVGESSYRSILWLFAWGDAGANAAAEDGGITTLRHMDTRIFHLLLGLYYEQTTIVYGD